MLFLFIHNMLYDWSVRNFVRSLASCKAAVVDLSSMMET